MTNRERILKSIEFIESNLKVDIKISDVASEAFCSLYHFIRLFTSITGISPKKYLLRRRLSESIIELQASEYKIVDIAYNFQFNSNEVFTRSFKKLFKIAPSKVRTGEIVPTNLITKPMTEDYILQSKKARSEAPELIELKQKIIIGHSYFISGDLKKLDLTEQWGSLKKVVDAIDNKRQPKDFFQIQYWSENQGLEGMHFFLGFEVGNLNEIDPQFVIKIIPEGSYLKFIHTGLSKNVGYTYRFIYEEFLPDTEYKLTKSFNFEYYGETYISADNDTSESFLFIPVEKLKV